MKNHNSILNPFSYLKRKVLQKQGTKAFTLVELIVVITILAILSTIGFVAYSGYLVGTRDTSRIASLKAISEGLEMYSTRHDLPTPDEKTTKIMSGTTQIATQGYVGENVLETITYSTEGKDPKDGTYYSYYLTKDKKYFQLMAFLEEEKTTTVYNQKPGQTHRSAPTEKNVGVNLCVHPVGCNTANAVDYSIRYPTVFGKKLGILTTKDNEPIQESTGTIDISNVGTLELKSYLKDNKYISGTGTIFSKLGQVAKKGGKFWNVQNNELVYYNPNSDASTLNIADIFGDGSNIATYTFDGNANDLNGNYNGTTTDVTYENGKFGKAAKFNGTDSSIIDVNISNIRSISIWFYNTENKHTVIFSDNRNSDNENISYLVWKDGTGTFYSKTTSDNDKYFTIQDNWSLNTWYHIVITKYNNKYVGYINGKKVADKIEFNGDILLKSFGNYTRNGGRGLNGNLDQVRIFNRALTENEISKLYNEK